MLLVPILWSLLGLFAKLTDWNGFALAGWRSFFSALMLWVSFKLLYKDKYRFDFSKGNLIIAVLYSTTSTCFMISTQLTTAANAVFLQASAPLYIAILGPFILKVKTQRRDIALVILTVIGLCMFFLNDMSGGNSVRELVGISIGASCGLSWALYLMFLKKQSAKGVPVSAMVIGNFITASYCLPFMASVAFTGDAPFAKNFMWAAILGVGPLGISYFLYVIAIRGVTAIQASLLQCMEPLLSPVWVYLLVKEVPGFWTFIGGGIILIVIVINSVLASRDEPAAEALGSKT
jgi:drug/metabolite transporter (DMT)-like permease